MHLLPPPTHQSPCLTIIGMPGAGKSTVGQALAHQLEWAFVDTDHLIEASYAARLQSITDAMGKEEFLDIESTIVQTLRVRRTVIATGGSVVYREAAMRHLQHLGAVIYLDVPLSLIIKRIALNPERGLAIAPGQTIEDLYEERRNLYQKYATHCIQAEKRSPAACVHEILTLLDITNDPPAT